MKKLPLKKRIHIQKIHLNQKIPEATVPEMNKVMTKEPKKTSEKEITKKFVKQKGKGSSMNNVLKEIPKSYHNSAKSLLLLIKDNNLFTWNKNNEIIVNSKKIKKSDLKKLFIHAITKKNQKPIGYKKFYEMLKFVTIPTFLMKNNLKKYVQQQRDELWHPPGVLKKKYFSV